MGGLGIAHDAHPSELSGPTSIVSRGGRRWSILCVYLLPPLSTFYTPILSSLSTLACLLWRDHRVSFSIMKQLHILVSISCGILFHLPGSVLSLYLCLIFLILVSSSHCLPWKDDQCSHVAIGAFSSSSPSSSITIFVIHQVIQILKILPFGSSRVS